MVKKHFNTQGQLSLFPSILHHTVKDEVDIYYDVESNLTGTSINGLARLVGCNKQTIKNAAVKLNATQDHKTHTGQGIQAVKLIPETLIPDVLNAIATGKRTSDQNKQKANRALSKLAQAGFRLMVLLEVAPDVVAKTAIAKIDNPEKAKQVSEYAEQHSKYLETYHGLFGVMKDHGANKPAHYAVVNKFNNSLIGIEKGKRCEMTSFQKDSLTFIQSAEKMKLDKSSVSNGWQAVKEVKATGEKASLFLQSLLED